MPKGYFETKHGLKLHMDSKHLGTPKYACKTCGQVFSYPRELDSHVNKHTGLKPNICKKCNKGFSHISDLYKHQQICGVVDNKFEWTLCHKNFKCKRYLTEHLKQHGNPEHRCLCGKQYHHQSSMFKHKKLIITFGGVSHLKPRLFIFDIYIHV